MKRLLSAASSRLYEDLPETILQYLDLHCLEYSDFVSGKICLEHEKVMASAASLLHDGSCICLDRLAGRTGVFYGIMDYQRQVYRNCFEGCYFAISNTISRKNSEAECHVIGQEFRYNASNGKENSFFAIRKKEGGHPMYTLEEASGCPVLPLFGCIDMAGLLVNVHSIKTKKQAARFANR